MAPTFGRERAPNRHEEERERRLKYQKEVEEKIERELQKIRDEEAENRKKIEAENERKRKKQELAKQIQEEIAAIKRMDEERNKKIKEEEQKKQKEQEELEKKRKQQEEIERKEEEARQRAFALEAMALREEARRMAEDAEKAKQKRLLDKMNAEIEKKEAEDKLKREIEAETRRLWEEEREKERLRAEEMRKARQEEEQRIAQNILERKQRELDEEKRAKEEMEAKIQRDREEFKQMELERKRKKFEAAKAAKEEAERVVFEKPRKKPSDNPFLMRFQEMSNSSKQEEDEEMKRASAEQRRQKQQEIAEKIAAKQKKKLMNKMAKVMSKETLTVKQSKQMIKAVSKELLRMLSNEQLKKHSTNSLHRSNSKMKLNSSTQKLKRSLSKVNLRDTSKRTSSKEDKLGANSQSKATCKDMQNYLISHVLFDGKENVYTSQHIHADKKSNLKLAKVNEDCANEDEQINNQEEVERNLPKENECEKEDRMFEAYKQEMEKYLSFFDDDQGKKKKKAKTKPKRVTCNESDIQKRPTLNLGTIRDQFEVAAEAEEPKKKEVKRTKPKKIGKLQAAQMFEEKPEEPPPVLKSKRKNSDYIPVIIDKAAFERTMGKFGTHKDEELERERKIEEERQRVEEEERLRLEKERLEEEYRQEHEERLARELAERQALEAEVRARQEAERKVREEEEAKKKKEKSMKAKILNFFSGRSKEEPSKEEIEYFPNEEVEKAKEEGKKLRMSDLQNQIQEELRKIKEKEEEHRMKIERENKKKELSQQIQEEIRKINMIHGTEATLDDLDKEEVPTWVKLVQDAQARKEYILQKQKSQDESIHTKQEEVKEQIKNKVLDFDLEGDVPDTFVVDWRDRKEQERLQKELEMKNRKEQPEPIIIEEKREEENKSSLPPMTYQESVEALIKLLQEDKRLDTEERERVKEKSNLMKKKKESVVLKSISDTKSQLQQQLEGTSSISSPATAPPNLEIGSDRVKQAKENLFFQSNFDEKKNGKKENMAMKKCGNIKKMFEKNTQNKKDTEKIAKRPKKIIQVKEDVSIEKQLEMKKRLNEKQSQWSYKKKNMDELYSYINSNLDLATKEVIQSATNAMKNSTATKNEQKDEGFDEYKDLMDSVTSYLDGQNEDNSDYIFRTTLNGYLSLIEDVPNDIKDSKEEKFGLSKPSDITSNAKVKQMASQMAKFLESGDQVEETKTEVNVGKIDINKFIVSSDSAKLSKIKASDDIRKGYCSDIKDQLEKSNRDTFMKNDDLTTKKMKLIQVDVPKSTEEALADLKEKNEQKWKWKQKMVQELDKLIKSNDEYEKEVQIANAVEEKSVTNDTDRILELQESRKRVTLANEKREKEFEMFMKDLEAFSETSASLGEEEEFQKGIKAYVSSVGTRAAETNMPPIKLKGLPIVQNLEDRKLNLMESVSTADKKEKPSIVNIKKINMALYENIEEDNEKDQLQQSARVQTHYCENLKHFFEKNIVKENPDALNDLKEKNEQSWKWKQKMVGELGKLIASNKDYERQVETVKMKEDNQISDDSLRISELEESRKRLKEANERREKEFETFMKELESFNESSSRIEGEDEFKDGIKAYVDSVKLDKDESGKQKTKIIKLPNILKLEERKLQLSENIASVDGKKEKEPLFNIKKIDIGMFEPGDNTDDEPNHQNNSEVRKQYCEHLKQFFEKNISHEREKEEELKKLVERENKKREVAKKIQEELRRINAVSNQETSDETKESEMAADIEERRKQQWKWKQKEIESLKALIKTNKDIENEICGNGANERKESQGVEDLQRKKEEIAKTTAQRDEDFQKFMQDLQTFSDTPSATADEDTFKSGLKSYLSLIDDDSKEYQNAELPSINLPSRMESLKGKLEASSYDNRNKKKPTTVGKVKSIFGQAKNDVTKDKAGDGKDQISRLNSIKASKIKKMFEEKPMKLSSRTMSELTLNKAPERREKFVIQVPTKHDNDMPRLERRNSSKQNSWSNRISSYFNDTSNNKPSSSLASKELPKTKIPSKAAKSEWENYSDPEEKRKAILAKYGFKPHEQIRSDNVSDDPLEDVDTIPEHVLNDEILYKKYLKENTLLPSSSDSSGSSTPTRRRDSKNGSFSSLMNILNAVKKSSMQKSAKESRARLDELKTNRRRVSTSDVDLSAVPGSCRNMKEKFDSGMMFENDTQNSSDKKNSVAKSTSCSNMQALWETHLNSSSSQQNSSQYRSTDDLPSSRSGQVIQAKHELLNSSISRPEKRSMDDIPSQGSNMVAQMKDLLASGKVTSEEVKKYLDDRSVVGEIDSVKRRKTLLTETPLNTDRDENSGINSIQQELDALRKSGQVKSTFQIERGRESSRSSRGQEQPRLRRSLSSTGVSGESRALDLDDEVMGELSVSNSMVRAMFEANAPKYKFGGSGDKLNDSSKKSTSSDRTRTGKKNYKYKIKAKTK